MLLFVEYPRSGVVPCHPLFEVGIGGPQPFGGEAAETLPLRTHV